MNEDPIVKEAKRRYRHAISIREPMEALYRDAYYYSMPERNGFLGRTAGEDRNSDLFDSTASDGVVEFASRLVDDMAPAFQRWMRLLPGSETPNDQRDDLAAALEGVTEWLMARWDELGLTAYLHAVAMDLSVGVGCLRVGKGTTLKPFNVQCIPIHELYLNEDAYGALGTFIHARKASAHAIMTRYPGATLPQDLLKAMDQDQTTFPIVEAIWLVEPTIGEEKWKRVVFLPEQGALLQEEELVGPGSNPIIASRWSAYSGEVWGRGPMISILPEVRTANYVRALVLQAAEFKGGGLWQYEDDGVINPGTIQLQPRAMIPYASGSRGLQNIAGEVDAQLAQFQLEEMRATIRRGLYLDDLGPLGRTPMSATEITERMAMIARRNGSHVARTKQELLDNFVRRCLRIGIEMGQVQVPGITPRDLNIQIQSRLTEGQSYRDATAINQWLQQMAALGPEIVAMEVETGRFAQTMARLMGVPLDLLRTKTEKAKIAAQVQQMRQPGP